MLDNRLPDINIADFKMPVLEFNQGCDECLGSGIGNQGGFDTYDPEGGEGSIEMCRYCYGETRILADASGNAVEWVRLYDDYYTDTILYFRVANMMALIPGPLMEKLRPVIYLKIENLWDNKGKAIFSCAGIHITITVVNRNEPKIYWSVEESTLVEGYDLDKHLAEIAETKKI